MRVTDLMLGDTRNSVVPYSVRYSIIYIFQMFGLLYKPPLY